MVATKIKSLKNLKKKIMTKYAAGYTGPMLPSAGPRKGVIGSAATTTAGAGPVKGPIRGGKPAPTPRVMPRATPTPMPPRSMMNKGGAVAKKTKLKKR